MKILVTIPHFYGPSERAQETEKKTGSAGGDMMKRLKVVQSCILSIYRVFGHMEYLFDIVGDCLYPANHRIPAEITVFICTTETDHLVDSLLNTKIPFRHFSSPVGPRHLGFLCHEVMRDQKDKYDYYCYLEDDIIVTDPFFFDKLRWFNTLMGNEYVLQPNRYETTEKGTVRKLYVDGTMPSEWTLPHKNLFLLQDISLEHFGFKVRFHASINPHSGCFFLNREQFETWTGHPCFLDGDSSFIGPLESAATLGIVKCFRPYKAAPECAHFFEVLHGDSRYIENINANLEIRSRIC